MAYIPDETFNRESFPGFQKFLKDLCVRSRKLAYDTASDAELVPALRLVDTFMDTMKSSYLSFFSLNLVIPKNHPNVLRQLKTIEQMEALPPKNQRLYALTDHQKLLINPKLTASLGFSQEEFYQLIITHELCHIIHQAWTEDRLSYADELFQDDRVRGMLHNMGLEDVRYLKRGFALLDEAIAQEVAERVTYYNAKRERPKKEYRNDKPIFDSKPYLTNYALYGELQSFADDFIERLPFIKNTKDPFQTLIQCSFDKDFIKKIKEEMRRHPELLDSFVMMLACMGRVYEATYKVLGLSNSKKDLNVNEYVDSFQKIKKM